MNDTENTFSDILDKTTGSNSTLSNAASPQKEFFSSHFNIEIKNKKENFKTIGNFYN